MADISDVCITDIGKALSEIEDAWSWLDSAQSLVERFEYLLEEYEKAEDKRTVAQKLKRAFEDAKGAIENLEYDIDRIGKALEAILSSCGSDTLIKSKLIDVRFLRERVKDLKKELERAYREKSWYDARSTLVGLDENEYSLRYVLGSIALFVKSLGKKIRGV